MISPPDCNPRSETWERLPAAARGWQAVTTVIASGATQSIAPRKKMDCFVALLLAMTAKARGSPEQRSVLRLQLFRGPGCEVGEDAVGAGALESQQTFHHRPLAVDPAIAGGGRYHRVFARYLVDECRHRKRVFDPPHDVEIGHPGLYHHHVRALCDVEFDLAQGLVGIGAVHLIGALVAGQRLCRADGVAERAVKGGGI